MSDPQGRTGLYHLPALSSSTNVCFSYMSVTDDEVLTGMRP